MMLCTSTFSCWNMDRFARTRRLNGTASREPSRIGRIKRGHRRRHTDRSDTISRPECFARESQTAVQKRVQVSLVLSFASFPSFPLGSGGVGSTREIIFISSGFE